MTATSHPDPTLAGATAGQMAREVAARLSQRIARLPDGARWTGMDWVFASVVAVLALGSTGFFTATYRVISLDPDYYYQRSLAALAPGALDLMETGAIGTAEVEPGEAMPAPEVLRTIAPAPTDYEIVMLFGEEVFLVTPRELMRAKVGSVLPGLGAMLAIEGRSVRFERATLTAVGD